MEHLTDGNDRPIFNDQVEFYCELHDLPSPNSDAAQAITLNDFSDLPQKLGWAFDDNTLLKPPSASGNLNSFAQRWLFFQVLFHVFGNLPTFTWEDFIDRDSSGRTFVTTLILPTYLVNWLENEKRVRKVKDQRVESDRRLVRIQQVLDQARYYVSRYVAVDGYDKNPKWSVHKLLALSLLVLGETLTRAQSKIHKAVGFRIRGWCSHDSHSYGWGYSKLMFVKLKEAGWCMKAVHRLMALLRGNTIGLMYLDTLGTSSLKGNDHKNCSFTNCRQEIYLSEDEQPVDPVQYHHCQQELPDHCSEESNDHYTAPNPLCTLLSIGSEKGTQDLVDVINKGSIPLFKFNGSRAKRPLELVEMSPSFDKSYAIFSHVWADGFGCFDKKNEIPLCVLDMFSKLLKKIAILRGGSAKLPELFWIDTLAVPEPPMYSKERLKAISQMHNIYTHAQYTVVLDLNLMRVNSGYGYSDPAMRITMSKWMTRMWTLQEAVLSKELFFNFNDRVCSMDSLEGLFENADASLHNCLPVVSRLYWHGILGSQRLNIRKQIWDNDGWQPNAEFLALVWKAAQWRTTAHLVHETLSLATMLNVEPNKFAESTKHHRGTSEYQAECDKRMIRLLYLFSKLSPCPIPPGMIFLPGPRLSEKGYGWAPRTWLTSHEIDSSDPISLGNPTSTRLTLLDGLEVQFPGFLLHDLGHDRENLHKSQTFFFPVDYNLSQWYCVESDENQHFPSGPKILNQELAIILPRPLLADLKEVALFVVVREFRSGIRFVELLGRVWIRRVGKEEKSSKDFRNGIGEAMSAGEVLDANERWCVDGPSHSDGKTEDCGSSMEANGDVPSVVPGLKGEPGPRLFHGHRAHTLTFPRIQGASSKAASLLRLRSSKPKDTK